MDYYRVVEMEPGMIDSRTHAARTMDEQGATDESPTQAREARATQFSSSGALPPVSQVNAGEGHETASERAFGLRSQVVLDTPAPVRVTTSGVNVRTSPDSTSNDNVIGCLSFGAEVDAVGREADWMRITYQGLPAYVHGSCVEVVSPDRRTEPAVAEKQPQLSNGGGGLAQWFHQAVANVGEAVTTAVSSTGVGLARLLGLPSGRTEPETERGRDENLGATAKPAFFNQRDNAFTGTLNGSEEGAATTCNATTLAMQLVTMAGSTVAVKARTIELMRELREISADRAADLMKLQVPDLIMELFELRGDGYWETASQSGQPPFWPGFYQFWKNFRRGDGKPVGWNEISGCLNFTARQYDFVAGVTFHEAQKDRQGMVHDAASYMRSTLKPALANGSTVMVSTRLTGGHIVMLVGVEEDGVRINDPYGMRLEPEVQHLGSTGYVRNGTAPLDSVMSQADNREHTNAEVLKAHRDIAIRRARFNPSLQAVIGAAVTHDPRVRDERPGNSDVATDSGHASRPINNWGENNFYTWDEVEKYQICSWDSIIDKS